MPAGKLPGEASCAAQKQGKFHEMHKAIWDAGRPAFSDEGMKKIAGGLGLNVDKFAADMKGECASLVQKDQSELAAVGTRGTPAFYINGRYLSGAQPLGNFKRVIDEELKKADARIGKGEATVANYYDKFVLGPGKKKFTPKPQ